MQMLLGVHRDKWIINDPKKLQHLKMYDIECIREYENSTSLFEAVQSWLKHVPSMYEGAQAYVDDPRIAEITEKCQDFKPDVAASIMFVLNNPHIWKH